jgi:23S rRNA (uridine2552-2'-O)-methyltransferase
LYAASRVGPSGKLLAIDLQPIAQAFPAWVTVRQSDALALDAALHEGFAPYDVVLSDMAPKTGGDRFTNAARSFELFQAAHSVARQFAKPGSSFVGKLFMGEDFDAAKASLSTDFEQVKVMKPQGTRKSSVEVFLVGLGLRSA